MRRRAFLAALGGAAVWPLAARAEQRSSLPRIGYLGPGAGPDPRYGEFHAGLRDLGYVEGKSIEIELRFAGGDPERLAEAAAEFVHENVDIIVTSGMGVYAAKRATTTVPVVIAAGADVVAMGLAASFSHPGGNITGSTFFVLEVMAKRLELLKQVAPSMSRSGLLLLRGNPFELGFAQRPGGLRQGGYGRGRTDRDRQPERFRKRAVGRRGRADWRFDSGRSGRR